MPSPGTVWQSAPRTVGQRSWDRDFFSDTALLPAAGPLPLPAEDLSPVHIPGTGKGPYRLTLLLGDGGITPDAGGELSLSAAHGSYQQDTASGLGEIKMGKGLMDIDGRKAQGLEEILTGGGSLNMRHLTPLLP